MSPQFYLNCHLIWLTVQQIASNTQYAYTINLAGNLSISSSTATFNPSIVFNGTGDQTISKTAGIVDQGSWSSTKASGNLNIVTYSGTVSSDTITWSGGSVTDNDGTVMGALTVSGGTFNSGVSTYTGVFTLSGGTFVASSTTTTFKSAFTRTSGTYTHNSGTTAFDVATTNLSITSGSAAFNNVTFTKSAAGGTVATLLDNISVAGNLSITATFANTYAVQSQSSLNPTITVAGDLLFPNVSTAARTLGSQTVANNLTVFLCGNVTISSPYANNYATMTDACPDAPSVFSGVANSTTAITWSWTDNSSAETGFKIYSDTDTLIATVSAGVTSYQETGLTEGTSYTRYVIAYVTGGTDSAHSNNTTVSTNANLPTVTTTTPITNVTATTATGGGTIVSNGGATVTVSGITWSTSANPTYTLGNTTTQRTDGFAVGSWTSADIGASPTTPLSPNTLYHVRAFAINSVGTSYGSDVTFTTTASSGGGSSGSNPRGGNPLVVIPMPDLTVTQFFIEYPATGDISGDQFIAKEGETVYLTVTFENQGETNAGVHALKFYVDNQLVVGIVNCTIPSLAGGVVQTYVCGPWTATTGVHEVKAFIDADNQIVESNENNNTSIKTLTVTSLPSKPDLTASSVTPTTATVNVAETYTASITNTGNSPSIVLHLFQYDNDDNHANGVTSSVFRSINAIGNNAGTISISNSHTFTTPGIKYVRVCADNNASFVGTVNESNEGNNCSPWTAVTIIPPGIRIVTRINGQVLTSNQNGTCSSKLVSSSGSSIGSCVRTITEIRVPNTECIQNKNAPADNATVLLGLQAPTCGSYLTPLTTGTYSLVWRGGYPAGADTTKQPVVTSPQRFVGNLATFFIDFKGDGTVIPDDDLPPTDDLPPEVLPPGIIDDSDSVFNDIRDNLVEKIIEISNTVVVDATKIAGLVVPALAIVPGLITNRVKFSAVFANFLLEIRRLWELLLVFFGIRKRRASWGTVYDSVTKQPLDPALVTAIDASGNVAAESITDLDGRYGFLLIAGEYTLKVRKTHYEFPSKKMAGQHSDELYQDLYFGEVIDVQKGEVIKKDIPMDPTGFDWNEFQKNKTHIMRFHSRYERLFAILSRTLFLTGLTFTILSIIISYSLNSFILLSLYAIVYLLHLLGSNFRPCGKIESSQTGEPLSYAILKVFTLDKSTLIKQVVADQYGQYYCLIPPGSFYIEIQNKNTDGNYSTVFTKYISTGKKGIVKEDFRVG